MAIGDGEKPLISIVMAAYNAERFIGEAIHSVLKQTYPHWELIIIDDASTDNTRSVILEWKDERIHYFYTERLGKPSSVRNKARYLCNGDYVVFFDSDDILLSDTLKNYLSALADSNHQAVYGFVKQISEDGTPIPSAGYKLIPLENGNYAPPRHYKHTWRRIALCAFVGTSCIMIRRNTLDRIGWFEEELPSAEDMHLYLKLFIDSPEGVIFLPRYVILYRQNSESLTRKRENIENLLLGHLRSLDLFFNHPAAPLHIQQWQSAAYARRYNYVVGICIGQGHRRLALNIMMRSFRDKRIQWRHWLWNCLTSLGRCLLPLAWDTQCKAWATQLRDGCLYPYPHTTPPLLAPAFGTMRK